MNKKMLIVEDYRDMATLSAGEPSSPKKVLVNDRRGASSTKRTGKPNVVLLVRQDAQAA